jgi:hypothetical protein
VLHADAILYVQAAVCMMVVIGILAMHEHVFDITRPLCHRCRAKCRCGLQQQGSQENKGE